MPDITNAGAIVFTDADLTAINAALLMLEQSFANKLVDANVELLSDEIASLDIERVDAIPADNTTLILTALPAFVNMSHWARDEKVREQLQPIASRLKTITQLVLNTNRAVFQRCWNYSNKY